MALQKVNASQYLRDGFLFPFDAFEASQVGGLHALFQRLRSLLPPGKPTEAMDWWHALDKELYNVCMSPAILERVEAILGHDFYLWGSQFFSKDPGDMKTVPWHQDAFYWPLSPHKTVTAWLAFETTDEQNGAMRVIPGSHTAQLKHTSSSGKGDVLDMQTEAGQFSEADAVSINLGAGQISLHDDNIIHGSGPNTSERLRCGLAIRFSAGEVKCDTSVWPFFKAFWAHGEDRWRHNPMGVPPAKNMTEYGQVTPRTGQR